jgi:hypothetical protein
MNVYYLDPGLASNHGHHAMSCRAFGRGFSAFGISPRVFGHSRIQPQICDELSATPLFSHSTYWQDRDAPTTALRTIEIIRQRMLLDLDGLPPIGARDLIVANSVSAGHLWGLADWLARKPPDQRPMVVAEFGHDPGIDPVDWPPQSSYQLRDPGVDARASVYRMASQALVAEDPTRAHFFTFERFCSALYTSVLGHPVSTLPSLIAAAPPLRNRTRRASLTLGIMGSQRREKGYHLVPEIMRELLSGFPSVCILIHNSGPTWMPETHQEVVACASGGSRVTLLEEPADPLLWQSMIARSDLILCPYDPRRYHASYSAVALEAIANGIPVIGPRYSSIHRLLQQFEGAGETFDQWTAKSIISTTAGVLQQYDSYAENAVRAGGRWNMGNGPKQAVGALLDLLQTGDVVPQTSSEITVHS